MSAGLSSPVAFLLDLEMITFLECGSLAEHTDLWSFYVLITSFYKNMSYIAVEPGFKNSFYFYNFKIPISKHSHILRYGMLSLNIGILEKGVQFSSLSIPSQCLGLGFLIRWEAKDPSHYGSHKQQHGRPIGAKMQTEGSLTSIVASGSPRRHRPMEEWRTWRERI